MPMLSVAMPISAAVAAASGRLRSLPSPFEMLAAVEGGPAPAHLSLLHIYCSEMCGTPFRPHDALGCPSHKEPRVELRILLCELEVLEINHMFIAKDAT